jgi:hypothetical protein
MEKDLKFSKYLLNESVFGPTVKKDVIKTIKGYLKSFENNSVKIIRDRLEHVHRVNNYSKIVDSIENEIVKLNNNYIIQIVEFINSKNWE